MVASKYPTKQELEEVFELRNNELWRKSFTRSNGMINKPKLVVNKKNTNDGYCQVGFKGRMIRYHHIIWILNKGDIPKDKGLIIDHKNGEKLDNDIEKLRLLTQRDNNNNMEIHRNGRLPGCYFNKQNKKWKAQICLNGGSKQIGLGYYLTELEAHEIYIYVKDNINNLHSKDELQDYARTHPNCTLRNKI
jgi:hypothetical protein